MHNTSHHRVHILELCHYHSNSKDWYACINVINQMYWNHKWRIKEALYKLTSD